METNFFQKAWFLKNIVYSARLNFRIIVGGSQNEGQGFFLADLFGDSGQKNTGGCLTKIRKLDIWEYNYSELSQRIAPTYVLHTT